MIFVFLVLLLMTMFDCVLPSVIFVRFFCLEPSITLIPFTSKLISVFSWNIVPIANISHNCICWCWRHEIHTQMKIKRKRYNDKYFRRYTNNSGNEENCEFFQNSFALPFTLYHYGRPVQYFNAQNKTFCHWFIIWIRCAHYWKFHRNNQSQYRIFNSIMFSL